MRAAQTLLKNFKILQEIQLQAEIHQAQSLMTCTKLHYANSSITTFCRSFYEYSIATHKAMAEYRHEAPP